MFLKCTPILLFNRHLSVTGEPKHTVPQNTGPYLQGAIFRHTVLESVVTLYVAFSCLKISEGCLEHLDSTVCWEWLVIKPVDETNI